MRNIKNRLVLVVSLTIIPRARMASESIAHEAEQLVGQKDRDKTTLASLSKTLILFLPPKIWRFSLLVGYI